ncbi:MAG: hypothetical protein NWF07_07930 [Candidatus Bathyarchaeota archaeon]|nr:hypothetical protein [Candidatus Bathyarchaeota archaeon]
MQTDTSVFGLSPSKNRLLVWILLVSLVSVSLGLGYTMMENADLENSIQSASNKVSSSILVSSLSSLSNSYLYITQNEAITRRDISTIMLQASDIEDHARILNILEPEHAELWDQYALFSYYEYVFMYDIDQQVYSLGVVPKDSLPLTEDQLAVFIDMKTTVDALIAQSIVLRTPDGGINETAAQETCVLITDFRRLVDEGYSAFDIA